MKALSILGSLLMTFVIIGCNDSKPYEGPVESAEPAIQQEEVKRPPYEIWTDLEESYVEDSNTEYEKILKRYGDIKVNCPAEGCHPSVALVIGKMGRCQGTLISEDEILTANHCVQDDVQRWDFQTHLFLNNLPKSCEQLSVVFPETKIYPQETIGCRTVRGVGKLDFAIIKLRKAIARPSVQLDGSTQTSKKTAVVMNALPSGEYQQEILTCEEYAPQFIYNSWKGKRALKECGFKRGNSGGAIFNEAGGIWGVISTKERESFEYAANASCIQAFRNDPWSSLNECLNYTGDMDQFLQTYVPGLFPKPDGHHYFTDYRSWSFVSTLPACIPDYKQQVKEIEFESQICWLSLKYVKGDAISKAVIYDCAPSKNTITLHIDFGPFYQIFFDMGYQRSNLGYAMSTYIKKCEEEL